MCDLKKLKKLKCEHSWSGKTCHKLSFKNYFKNEPYWSRLFSYRTFILKSFIPTSVSWVWSRNRNEGSITAGNHFSAMLLLSFISMVESEEHLTYDFVRQEAGDTRLTAQLCGSPQVEIPVIRGGLCECGEYSWLRLFLVSHLLLGCFKKCFCVC